MPAKRKTRNAPTPRAPEDTRERGDRPLVSHSTILILSGFLIGVVAVDFVNPRLERLLQLTAAFGLVSYLGLGYVAWLRQKHADNRARKRATSQLERRLGRHVPRTPGGNSKQASVPFDQQYVTVVHSKRADA